VAGKLTGITALTQGFHDPALRAKWEREEQNARNLALRKLNEIEKLYRAMQDADGLGLDLKDDADVFDFKRLDTEAMKPIIGRYLMLKNIALVREVLKKGRPWSEDFTNLRDRHERLLLALGPDLVRALASLAGSRKGHRLAYGSRSEIEQRRAVVRDWVANEKACGRKREAAQRAFQKFSQVYPKHIRGIRTIYRYLSQSPKK
jgi:hypothetical protein